MPTTRKRSERSISRCGLCGAWQWRRRCATPHDREAAYPHTSDVLTRVGED